MKLSNTLLIILITLSLNTTAYASSYSKQIVIPAESPQLTDSDYEITDEEEDDEC